MTSTIRVQREDFDPGAIIESLSAGRPEIGAVTSFVGLCRDEGGRLSALELEHYPGMAEEELGRIAGQATARWSLLGLTIVHRFGLIRPGERIVAVAAAAGHREPAFAGAAFLMDFLKTNAPFWKREHRADGSVGSWVEAKASDDGAAARWGA